VHSLQNQINLSINHCIFKFIERIQSFFIFLGMAMAFVFKSAPNKASSL
jgi:hypothetical protein